MFEGILLLAFVWVACALIGERRAIEKSKEELSKYWPEETRSYWDG